MDNRNATITVREIRQILFDFSNQDLTIGDLRRALFDIQDQEQPHQIAYGLWKEIGLDALLNHPQPAQTLQPNLLGE